MYSNADDSFVIVDSAVVAPLMAWVERETGQTIPVLPDVVASRDLLIEMASGTDGHEITQAAYAAGVVVLDSLQWNPEDSTQSSFLVHELVHHAQAFMPDDALACPNAREAQAYALQNKWLEENGHHAMRFRPIPICGGLPAAYIGHWLTVLKNDNRPFSAPLPMRNKIQSVVFGNTALGTGCRRCPFSPWICVVVQSDRADTPGFHARPWPMAAPTWSSTVWGQVAL
ncbi:MAG: hypothetical protein HQM04_17365 [Magnetococcales bacterium]|nr:hypothetical protein [Magnetococcales bacterium]MBF0116800.1 hypothetical protein [Magnetococcales bacterium]